MSDFSYVKDAEGIVTVTMDMQGQPVNTMNEAFCELLRQATTQLEAETDLTGVIVTSAKSTFFAGADIKQMLTAEKTDLAYWRELNLQIKTQLRRLENLKVPVVAAINGAALGGGYEICLSCHYRIAIENDKTLIGLPEVTLGLLPGGGGVVRLVRLLGIEKALLILLKGAMYKPTEALELGLINALATDKDDLIEQSRTWIKAHPNFAQPWNDKNYQIPGGTQKTNPSVLAKLQSYPAILTKQFNGHVPPAPKAILATAAESLQIDVDGALAVESRYFLSLLTTPEAKERMLAFVEKRK